MALWRAELDQRIAHELRPNTIALEAEVTEFAEGEVLTQDGIAVTAFAVDHRPVRDAFGFAFEAEGRRLIFSGDTAPCPSVVAAAKDADVLVHECFIHGVMQPETGRRTAEGLANVAAYHTASSTVGKIATEAGARLLVLHHFVPTRFDKRAVLAEVRRDFAGPVVVGEDLMRLDVTTGALSHAGAEIGLGGGGFPGEPRR
jgi:ribonuclease Z